MQRKTKGIPRSATCLKLVKICYKIISLSQDKKDKQENSVKFSTRPITEISSSQMIAIKNKKSSIGSLNSVLDRTFNWIDELDALLRNIIYFSIEKLNTLDNLREEIDSPQSLVKFLELDKKYPGIEGSSTLEDFFNSISGLSGKTKMTYLDLYIVLSLCNLGYEIFV